MLSARYGGHEGARLLAKIVGAVEEHGLTPVAAALTTALQSGRCDLLDLGRFAAPTPPVIEVPASLRGIEVERRDPRAYDALLVGVESAMSRAAVEAVIAEQVKVLKLPAFGREYPALCRQAREADWSYEDFLRELLEAEVRSARRAHGGSKTS